MMKKLTLFLLTVAVGLSSWAQGVYPCGFDQAHREMMATNRDYENAVRSLNTGWVSYSRLMSMAMLTYTARGYVYEIPMVVHVIHTGGTIGTSYNPDSSTKIAQMIDYMNKNYAAVSPFPDTTAGGCRIPLKFVLAKRAPDGSATNGIIRIDGTTTLGSTYSTYGVKRSSSSGVTTAQIMALSRWNPSDYYNCYVVNKIDGNDLYPPSPGGVAGFAYFPGSPSVDGMVVLASQVKSGSTTVAHEYGHAFSLYHTFEDDETFPGSGVPTCPPNTDCTTDGDMVCDTEPHIRENVAFPSTWCPPTDVNSCTGSSYNNTQRNVMDYTNCPPDRFTAGQRTRVLYTLDNIRCGYKYSAGLLPPDGLIASVCSPISGSTTGAFGPYMVSLKNIQVWTGSLGMENAAYVDHAYTQQIRASVGEVIPISVTTYTNRQNVKVYVDYNNDGDFTDAGEQVYTHNGTSSDEVHSGSFTIPSGVSTCTWLRVRVVAGWYAASIGDWICGPYANNAQAEDYGLYIKNITSADTVTIAQTAGTNPSCTGSSVTFTATPKSGTPTYRWYVNGVATAVTTNTYTSTTLADGDIITCKTFYIGSCGADSAVSNPIILRVSSSALAVAKNTLKVGTNPGCSGQVLVFKVNVSGGGPSPVYSWRRNGTVVGGNVDTFTSSTLVAGDRIWCRVTPNSTCTTTPVNSDTITISFASVVPSAVNSLIAGTNPSCDSSSLTFETKPTNGGTAPQYQWYVNSMEISGATAATYTEPYLKNNDTVNCRIISNHPCIVTGSGDTAWSNKIVVQRDARSTPTLAVNISRGYNPGCLDSLLEFTATVTNAGSSPLIAWYVNGAIASYGSVFGSTTFANHDTISCKMFVTAGSCTTDDSLAWGPLLLKLSPTPSTPVISLIGTLLVSSIPTNVQWYGPSGLIPGATGPTYHPTTNGNYYAVCVNDGCNSIPSNVLNVSLLSIRPYNMNEVRIYPNPTSGILTLDWGSEKMNGNVDVYTVTGQKVMNVVLENQTKHVLNLTHLADATYFVVIRDDKGKTGTVSITVAH